MTSIIDREFWEDFISLYQHHPCLWNSKSKEYSNKHLRDAAYSELVEKARERYPTADRDFVTKKIHTLRCSFRREHKKVLDSKKFRATGNDIYVPTLWYYDQLSFITDYGYTRSGKTNGSGSDEEEHEDADYASQFVETHQNTSNDEPESSTRHSTRRSLNSDTTASNLSTGKRKYIKGIVRKHFAPSPVKKVSPPKLENETLDEFDIAGRKYACDLKNMTPQQRMIVEKIVAEAIYYGKMEQLNVHSSIQFDNNYVHTPFIPKIVDYTSESGTH